MIYFICFHFIISLFCFYFNFFLGAPTAPTNIKFTERLEGFIVHWDFLRKDISKYEFRLTTEDNKNLDYTLEESKKQKDYILKYEIRNLKRGVIYKFQMRAVDKNNQIGEWSSSVDVKTVTEIAPYSDRPLALKTAVAEKVDHLIKCEIRGEPTPKIEWTVNGKVIEESDSRYKMNNDKGEIVLVKPLRDEVNGIYQCKGTNQFGSVSNIPTTVDVECK